MTCSSASGPSRSSSCIVVCARSAPISSTRCAPIAVRIGSIATSQKGRTRPMLWLALLAPEDAGPVPLRHRLGDPVARPVVVDGALARLQGEVVDDEEAAHREPWIE